MKKCFIAAVSFLLLFALLVAVVRISNTDSVVSGGSINKSENDTNTDDTGTLGDEDSGENTLSWIDPVTGIDIFEYDNELSFFESMYCRIELVTCDVYDEDGVEICADSSVLIPSAIYTESGDEFKVSDYEYCIDGFVGTTIFKSGYTYYAYYATELNGSWDRMGINGCEDTYDGYYSIGLSVQMQDDDYLSFEQNSFTVPYDAVCTLGITNGMSGTAVSSNTGLFYVRLICVPNAST